MSNKVLKIAIIIICVIFTLSFLFLLFSPKKKITSTELEKKRSIGPQIEDIQLEKPLAILLMGTDSAVPKKLSGWNGRTDFMVVVYINPTTDKVSIISVPRDTYIDIEEFENYNIHKINSVNSIGGFKLSKKYVQKLLGIKIDHVCVINIATAIEILNDIGPLKIFVPKKMSYHDYSADLHIEIEPGLRTMDGYHLINYLRYRNADKGDIGRIERQQVFFRAILKRLRDPKVIFKIPSILAKANKSFLTDMKFSQMFELGILLRSLSPKNFQTFIIPGDFGPNGYWLSNQSKLKSMMELITKGTYAKLW